MTVRLKITKGTGDAPDEQPGYRLGLVSGRQEFARYTWPKVVALARKEALAGSSNALRLSIHVFGWDFDGKQDPRFAQVFTGEDSKAAIDYAKSLVSDKILHSTTVMAEAGRLYAQRGFGDRASFVLAHIEPME